MYKLRVAHSTATRSHSISQSITTFLLGRNLKISFKTMKHLRIITFLITIIMTTSCSVSYLTVTDEVVPPKIEFPDNIQSVILFNRSLERDLGQRLSSGVILDAGHKEIIRYVVNKMPIRAQAHNKTVRDSRSGERADRFAAAEVRQYGAGYDGLFCLEQLHHTENRTYNSYEKHQLDEQGKDYYVDAVKGSRTTTCKAFWRLYEVKSGKVLLELPYQIEDNLEAEALSRQGLNVKFDTTSVPDPDKMKYETADALIRDLSPTKMQSNWMYYKKGHDDIKRTAEYFKNKRYDLVVRTYARNRNAYSNKEKERVLYNLATAHFLNGDREEAIRMASEGARQYDSAYFRNLIQKMKN